MTILRLLILCMMTASAFAASNPTGDLTRFKEDVRVLPNVALPFGGILVAERVNYLDPAHYAAAELLDPQSSTDTSSASALLPMFPQWHEAAGKPDEGARIKEISDMLSQEPSLPFLQYIVFLQNGAEKQTVGTFALSIPEVDEDASIGFRTEFTVFILRDFRGEYKGNRLARLMNDAMGELVGRMLSKSCRTMGDEGHIVWSPQGLDGWVSYVSLTNYPSLGLALNNPEVGVAKSEQACIKFLWPANAVQIEAAEQLRAVVAEKKAAFKVASSGAAAATAGGSGGASS